MLQVQLLAFLNESSFEEATMHELSVFAKVKYWQYIIAYRK